jgi:ankyrin repeat protein
MDATAFDVRMKEIAGRFEADDFPQSLQLARTLKRDLLDGSAVDPLQLGWARYYEFKSLFALKDYRGTYDLLNAPERVPFAVSSRNAAWMSSVGAECAMHLDIPDEVVRLAGRCLEGRELLKDLEGQLMAAATACRLLEMIHREDLNDRFARELVRLGRKHSIPNALHEGYRHLIANVGKTGREDLVREVAERADELYGLFGQDTDPLELHKTIHRIESADWYVNAISPDKRRRIDLTRRLWEAAESGDAAAVEAALRDGADVNARYVARGGLPTALIAASFGGHAGVVDFLLERGADTEIPNGQGRTALIQAADQGHAEVVRRLLRRGARPGHADFQKQTALHVAGWQGHLDAVKALLECGAGTEARDRTGNTPLSLAATEDVPDVVAALLDGGANLEATNDEAQTPLMIAAMEGMARVVALLLKRGANAAAQDRNGMTALDWARREKHAEAEQALRQHLEDG